MQSQFICSPWFSTWNELYIFFQIPFRWWFSSLLLFSRFSFSFCLSKFNYNVSQWGSAWFIWSSLSFLDVYIHVFSNILSVPFSLSSTSGFLLCICWYNWRCLTGLLVSLSFSSFFLFLLLRLNNFNLLVFMFADSFFCLLKSVENYKGYFCVSS